MALTARRNQMMANDALRCCPKCGADFYGGQTDNDADAEWSTPKTSPDREKDEQQQQESRPILFGIGDTPPTPLAGMGGSLDNNAYPPASADPSSPPVTFEVGVNSRDSTPSIRLDDAPPSFVVHDPSPAPPPMQTSSSSSSLTSVRRGRHLSDTHNEEASPSPSHSSSSSVVGRAARQHWVTFAPRGSLEIRSPAKEMAMMHQGRLLSGGAVGGLTQNRSDSKLAVRSGAGTGGFSFAKNQPSGGGNKKGRRMKERSSRASAEKEQMHNRHQSGQDGGGGGGGGNLPRTLSTSVLRIKHRRSFWEKVIG